ncbi:hypothetical protein WA026_017483 [Henosepilachna vigintioctopunctata]|uniref:Uncharacterized protein n=1 Tax=Henosepilachna vigintioctopunctata TaxID=420089 RepID=A0AAW1USP5_9CUCU
MFAGFGQRIGDASVSDRAAYPGGGRCVCSGAGGTCNREGKLLKNLDLFLRLPVYGFAGPGMAEERSIYAAALQ